VSVSPTPEQVRQAAEMLRRFLRYEPETGKLFWKRRVASDFNHGKYSPERSALIFNGRMADREALNCLDDKGYLHGTFAGKKLKAHRAIWVIVTGQWPEEVDHINHKKSDNRWSNLRAVTREQNSRNRGIQKNNTSGITGVRYAPEHRKWIAQIHVNKRLRYLGLHKTREEAVSARHAAELEYGFHGNHGRTTLSQLTASKQEGE
jgi:hypothetical protein